MSAEGAPTGSLRLDKFLWFARLARTRSAAARLCAGGKVRLNAAVVRKANHPVRIGDTLTIELGRARRRLRVVALGTRRGAASTARTLYEESAPPERAPREPWVTLFEEI